MTSKAFSSYRSHVFYWALMGVLSAAAAAVQIIESPLPRILPWLKPGLSNALVLYGIVRVSPMFGFGVVITRSFLTGIALGIIFSPPHWLSIVGGLASATIMSAAFVISRRKLGLAGISVLGAIANNIAQLSAVELFFPGSFSWTFHLAIMIWVAVPSGLIVAAIARELLRRTE